MSDASKIKKQSIQWQWYQPFSFYDRVIVSTAPDIAAGKLFRQYMSGASSKQVFSTHAYCYKNKDFKHLKCRTFLPALKFCACFCSLFASVFAIHWSVCLPTTAPFPKDGNRQPANHIASLTRNNIVEIGLSTLYQIVWAFLCYYPEVL